MAAFGEGIVYYCIAVDAVADAINVKQSEQESAPLAQTEGVKVSKSKVNLNILQTLTLPQESFHLSEEEDAFDAEVSYIISTLYLFLLYLNTFRTNDTFLNA